MKNFVKDSQKLPLYGIGPRLVLTMAMVSAIKIVLFCYIFKTGVLVSPWLLLFRITGGVLIALGIFIWAVGAFRSDMDENISENRLKTDGIYAWVRNPMYSGWWMLLTGISLMYHNAWLLATPLINWGIMTAVLKNTEEKWLKNLYGKEYEDYCKRMNRCVPWKYIDREIQSDKREEQAMIKTTMNIEGMMCGMCEAHIRDAIRKAVPSAKKVAASKEKSEASFLTEECVDEELLKAAIDATGYTCLGIESSPYQKKGLFSRR